MKNKRSRVVLIIFIALFIFSGILHFLFGYIPIVGHVIANIKLSNYVGNFVSASYSFPSGDGYSAVLENGVTVKYDLKQNTIFDSEVTSLFQHSADDRFNEVRSMFQDSLVFPDKVNMRTWIDADDYDEVFHRIDILNVFNDETLDEDESFRMPAKIAQIVMQAMGSKYNFQSVHVIYADSNGMYECVVKFKRGIELSETLLIESTTKLPNNELPEDYLQWLDQQ